jgi:hypothetical protein
LVLCLIYYRKERRGKAEIGDLSFSVRLICGRTEARPYSFTLELGVLSVLAVQFFAER